jgi:hypothetical protein
MSAGRGEVGHVSNTELLHKSKLEPCSRLEVFTGADRPRASITAPILAKNYERRPVPPWADSPRLAKYLFAPPEYGSRTDLPPRCGPNITDKSHLGACPVQIARELNEASAGSFPGSTRVYQTLRKTQQRASRRGIWATRSRENDYRRLHEADVIQQSTLSCAG